MLIIGTGLAGLRAAISAAMTNDKLDIGVISKVQVMRSHSVSAEGGTAAVLFSDEGDNIESHIYDTIRGSDFLCDQDVAEKLELAPRDVVSRSMIKEIDNGRGFIHETGVSCLKLDLTHLGEERIKEKLAGIREIGIKFLGVDIISEPIEIRPVCHYMMGGIHSDINGGTEMNGLWAAGEAAC